MSSSFISEIRRFYEAHERALFTYALALTRRRELAEDVVHTVFCGILRRGRMPRDLRVYAFKCIRNAALRELRRQNHHARLDVPPEPQHPTNLERAARLEDALEALTSDERECIVLKLCDDMTFKEVAALRGVSINTVSSWYRRGLDKLRTLLRETVHE